MAWTSGTRKYRLACAIVLPALLAVCPVPRAYSQSKDGISFEEYRRTFPPAPAAVQAATRDGKVIITWEMPPVAPRSEKLAYDPAIDHYRVYRVLPGRDMMLIGETPETSFEDTAAPAGMTQRYVVTAVQRSGHESAPSREAVVRIP